MRNYFKEMSSNPSVITGNNFVKQSKISEKYLSKKRKQNNNEAIIMLAITNRSPSHYKWLWIKKEKKKKLNWNCVKKKWRRGRADSIGEINGAVHGILEWLVRKKKNCSLYFRIVFLLCCQFNILINHRANNSIGQRSKKRKKQKERKNMKRVDHESQQ